MLAWIFLFLPLLGSPEARVQEANEAASQAEKAATYQERKLALNRALYLYSLAGEDFETPPADLDRAIGDLYDQLEEYPWAILFYHRALNANPQDAIAASHLKKVQQKMGMGVDSPLSGLQNPFIGYLKALSHQNQLVFWLLAFTFLTCSFALCLSSPWIRKMAAGSSFLLALLLANSLFFYYFTPIEGILVASSGFYRSPDKNEPQLTAHPLLAGSKVTVLQMAEEGNWVKIANSDGLIGYIPAISLRLI